MCILILVCAVCWSRTGTDECAKVLTLENCPSSGVTSMSQTLAACHTAQHISQPATKLLSCQKYFVQYLLHMVSLLLNPYKTSESQSHTRYTFQSTLMAIWTPRWYWQFPPTSKQQLAGSCFPRDYLIHPNDLHPVTASFPYIIWIQQQQVSHIWNLLSLTVLYFGKGRKIYIYIYAFNFLFFLSCFERKHSSFQCSGFAVDQSTEAANCKLRSNMKT